MLEGEMRIVASLLAIVVCGCASKVTIANAQAVHCAHPRDADEVRLCRESGMLNQQASNPPTPDTSDLAARASSFVLELLRIWSEPNDAALSRLNAFYAEQVFYYGKLTTRQAVLDDKTRFATRWPERKYQLRPGSLVANCEQIPSRCKVDRLVDWQTGSPARGASSSGSARISYTLTAVGPSFMVISENSSVLRGAKPTSLPPGGDLPGDAAAAPEATHNAHLSQNELAIGVLAGI
jgi:hypothetical protein